MYAANKVDSPCRSFRFLIITLIEFLIANPSMQSLIRVSILFNFLREQLKSYLSKKAAKSMTCSLDERLVACFS